MKNGLFAIDDQRVSRVVPALETHYRVGIAAQQVDDFSLALVTPLGAENHDISIHAHGLRALMKKLQQESTGEHTDDAADADDFRIVSGQFLHGALPRLRRDHREKPLDDQQQGEGGH